MVYVTSNDTMSDTTKPGRERTILVIEAGPDPLYVHHGINRDPNYRLRVLLKRLLRDLGFKCVSCGPETPPKPPAKSERP
jgi:hypothetical protein